MIAPIEIKRTVCKVETPDPLGGRSHQPSQAVVANSIAVKLQFIACSLFMGYVYG